MNRIAVRLSVGFLVAVVLTLISGQIVMQWYLVRAFEKQAPSRERFTADLLRRYLAAIAPQDRDKAIRELSTALGVPVELMKSSDSRIPEAVRYSLAEHGLKMELTKPFDFTLWIRLSEGSDVVRVDGPMIPQKPPPLWPLLVILLGLLLMVLIAGTLMSYPIVRRLKALQEVAVQIAMGDLKARASVSGNDAISKFSSHFNQMADRNQILLEKQRDLMRAVAHELRTPTARIRFAIELVLDATSAAERERHIAAIDSDLSEMDSLVEELLLIDRLDSGPSSTVPDSFIVHTVLRNEISRLSITNPQIDISITSSAPENMLAPGNEMLFKRAIRNVLSNALRHARKKVVVSVAKDIDELVICIDDDGPGIAPKDRARVLEPFIRLDASRSRKSGGFGLGLTIVDRILQKVGGSVKIGDADLGGARFVVSWPTKLRASSG